MDFSGYTLLELQHLHRFLFFTSRLWAAIFATSRGEGPKMLSPANSLAFAFENDSLPARSFKFSLLPPSPLSFAPSQLRAGVYSLWASPPYERGLAPPGDCKWFKDSNNKYINKFCSLANESKTCKWVVFGTHRMIIHKTPTSRLTHLSIFQSNDNPFLVINNFEV